MDDNTGDYVEPVRPERPLDLAGTAARTRIREYRLNSGDRDRSLAGLLQWAAECGVEVPDYAKVECDENFRPTYEGLQVDAKYYEFQGAFPDELIYRSSRANRRRSIIDAEAAVLIVNLAPEVLKNDERFLHVLAHEVFEIKSLKQLFDESGGCLPAGRLYALIQVSSTMKNLHWFAWEHADSLIEERREADK